MRSRKCAISRKIYFSKQWSQKKQAVLKSTLQSLSGSAHAWFSHIERNKKPRKWEKKFRQNWPLSFGVWLAILRSQNLVKFTLKLRRLPQYYALIPLFPLNDQLTVPSVSSVTICRRLPLYWRNFRVAVSCVTPRLHQMTVHAYMRHLRVLS